MVWAPVRRGLALGVIAGLLAGLFAFLVGEPLVQDAIDIEESKAAAHASLTFIPAHISDLVVSREAQRGGLFLGNVAYGIAMGVIFSAVFLLVRGRGRPRSDWHLSVLVAGSAFVALALVPFIKYPANPPAVGDPDTIGERTWLYLTLLVGGALAVLAAVRVGRIAERGGAGEPWRRPVAMLLTFAGLVLVLVVALPDVDEVPANFPASLLWKFRLSSLGTQAVFWSALGIGYGIAAERAARQVSAVRTPVRAAA
ncbi:CbtA family protein [Paraconexibacter sp.]|uniref:CbtA family protein n=1 Tax=Paraconexibacter sp. TaxID=2949640 RepID=UPI00356485B4